jgi:hypothetical protein
MSPLSNRMQVIGFAVFMIVPCAVWTWLIKRRPLRALVSLLDEGYGQIERLLEPHIEGHFHGRFARFVSNTEGSISLSSFIGDYLSAGVRNQKEGFVPRVEKLTRRFSNLDTGDPELDRQLAFFCFQKQRFTTWMRGPATHQTITSLFESQEVDRLRLHSGYLESTMRVYFRKKWKPANVSACLPFLAHFEGSFPPN